jgi:cytochrome c553
MMKKINIRTFASLAALAVVLSVSAGAQDAAALYKSKCAGCHGADGKKVAAADLSGADVHHQRQTSQDAEVRFSDTGPGQRTGGLYSHLEKVAGSKRELTHNGAGFALRC